MLRPIGRVLGGIVDILHMAFYTPLAYKAQQALCVLSEGYGVDILLIIVVRGPARVLRAGASSPLHGVVFTIFVQALRCPAEEGLRSIRDTRSLVLRAHAGGESIQLQPITLQLSRAPVVCPERLARQAAKPRSGLVKGATPWSRGRCASCRAR
jgi:hypothetical protein